MSRLSILQGIFPTRDQTQVSHIAGRFFTSWTTREAWYMYRIFFKGSWYTATQEEPPEVVLKLLLCFQDFTFAFFSPLSLSTFQFLAFFLQRFLENAGIPQYIGPLGWHWSVTVALRAHQWPLF